MIEFIGEGFQFRNILENGDGPDHVVFNLENRPVRHECAAAYNDFLSQFLFSGLKDAVQQRVCDQCCQFLSHNLACIATDQFFTGTVAKNHPTDCVDGNNRIMNGV